MGEEESLALCLELLHINTSLYINERIIFVSSLSSGNKLDIAGVWRY